jgi:hypothetical protein
VKIFLTCAWWPKIILLFINLTRSVYSVCSVVSFCSGLFIRFPFVDGLPPSPKPRKPILRRSPVPRPSSIVHALPRRPRFAICRPHSFIRSPFVDGLPSSPKPQKPILRRPPVPRPSSSTVHALPRRPSRRPRSAIRRPHSFIRSPFVDGLPSSPKPQEPVLPKTSQPPRSSYLSSSGI